MNAKWFLIITTIVLVTDRKVIEAVPTVSPSFYPSTQPTLKPSSNPSRYPSYQPSPLPSTQPTLTKITISATLENRASLKAIAFYIVPSTDVIITGLSMFLKNVKTRIKVYTKTHDVEEKLDFKSWRKLLTKKYQGVGDAKAVDLGSLQLEISENEQQKILFAAGENVLYSNKIEPDQNNLLVKDSIVSIHSVGGIRARKKHAKRRKRAKRKFSTRFGWSGSVTYSSKS